MTNDPFVQDKFAERIRLERYGAFDTESWEEHCSRISSHVARYSEKQDKYDLIQKMYYEELVTNRILPWWEDSVWFRESERTAP